MASTASRMVTLTVYRWNACIRPACHFRSRGHDGLAGDDRASLVCGDLQRRGITVLDINEIYAGFATQQKGQSNRPPFKLGIVGGVGPAATVDFMGKVVAHTPAGRDQSTSRWWSNKTPRFLIAPPIC